MGESKLFIQIYGYGAKVHNWKTSYGKQQLNYDVCTYMYHVVPEIRVCKAKHLHPKLPYRRKLNHLLLLATLQ